MTAPKFTTWSLMQCARREIAARKRVYPRRIAEGKMTQATADLELAAMTAIYELLQRLERDEAQAMAPTLDLNGDAANPDR
jgi:hypothetical protein